MASPRGPRRSRGTARPPPSAKPLSLATCCLPSALKTYSGSKSWSTSTPQARPVLAFVLGRNVCVVVRQVADVADGGLDHVARAEESLIVRAFAGDSTITSFVPFPGSCLARLFLLTSPSLWLCQRPDGTGHVQAGSLRPAPASSAAPPSGAAPSSSASAADPLRRGDPPAGSGGGPPRSPPPPAATAGRPPELWMHPRPLGWAVTQQVAARPRLRPVARGPQPQAGRFQREAGRGPGFAPPHGPRHRCELLGLNAVRMLYPALGHVAPLPPGRSAASPVAPSASATPPVGATIDSRAAGPAAHPQAAGEQHAVQVVEFRSAAAAPNRENADSHPPESVRRPTTRWRLGTSRRPHRKLAAARGRRALRASAHRACAHRYPLPSTYTGLVNRAFFPPAGYAAGAKTPTACDDDQARISSLTHRADALVGVLAHAEIDDGRGDEDGDQVHHLHQRVDSGPAGARSTTLLTVKPMTVAACDSLFLPQPAPSSSPFFALSHAPPESARNTAIRTPAPIAPARSPKWSYPEARSRR